MNQKQILVVEDDINSQLLFTATLRNQFKIHYALSYDQALTILEDHTIDLILLDISLVGNKDGLDLAREIRKNKRFSYIPIIVVTAHALKNDRKSVFDAGCDDYLMKPFKQNILLDKIQSTIGNS